MKIRFWDRCLVALAGLCLLIAGVAVLLWSVHLFPARWLEGIPNVTVDQAIITIVMAVAILVVVLGCYCISILFRYNQGRKGFVIQKTENGEMSISIKAMESLVQKCVDKHGELNVISTSILNARDGISVALRIGLANGVSIPLAVNSLQKQIKQYITACSGIEVKQVRVQVETTSAKLEDSPYAIPEVDSPAQSAPQAPRPVKPLIVDQAIPEAEALPDIPITAEPTSKRPLHQRLFGREEQPATLPTPPAEELSIPVNVHEEPQEAEQQAQEPAPEAAQMDFVADDGADQQTEPVEDDRGGEELE